MKANGGELIKNLRKNMGISQEELAQKLFMSQRKLSRIEAGEAELDILEFITAFSVLGFPTEDFWIMHLTYEDFEGYTQYIQMRRLLRNGDMEGIRSSYPQFKQTSLMKRSFMSQFASYIGLIVDDTMPPEDKLRELYSALKLTLTQFEYEKIDRYRLSYNEVLIINEIALLYSRQGDDSKAIALLSGIAQSADKSRMTDEERRLLLPKPLVDLCKLLLKTGKYEKAVKICESALNQSRLYVNYRFAPEIVYTMGICYQKMGKSPGEYMPMFKRAYHAARGAERHSLANMIRQEHGAL